MSSCETLRGAIIGYGFIASKGHLPAYRMFASQRHRIDIVALADVCDARRAAARDSLPGVHVYSDFRELIQKERNNLDFVDITTPPLTHAAIAHAALDAGLHVLCEKPLAMSFEDAKSIAAHAHAVGRVLFPCHNYKHSPVIRAVNDLIKQGAIGKIKMVTLQTFRPTHARGVSEWKPDWRRERQFSGGGIGMDHGAHTFYLAFDWLRAYPTAISASIVGSSNWDTEDTLACVARFPNGLMTGLLTWGGGSRRVTYALQGEFGSILVDDDDITMSRGKHDETTNAISYREEHIRAESKWGDASHSSWFVGVLESFVTAIAQHDIISSDTVDSIHCVNAIMAAYESARQKSLEIPVRPLPKNSSRLPRADTCESRIRLEGK